MTRVLRVPLATARYLPARGPVHRGLAHHGRVVSRDGGPSSARPATPGLRVQLGPPLAAQMLRGSPRRWNLPAVLLAAGVGVSAVAWLARPDGRWLLAAAAISLFVCLAARFTRVPAATRVSCSAWIETQVVESFDRRLAEVAAGLRPQHRERLREIKARVAAVARMRIDPTGTVGVSPDQAHEVVDILDRAVLSALDAYIAVPAARRAHPLAASLPTPDALLDRRLTEFCEALRRCESGTTRSAIAALLRELHPIGRTGQSQQDAGRPESRRGNA